VHVLANSVVSSGTSHRIIELAGAVAILLWLALGYWTYRDAQRRIESPEFIDDRRERELEIRAIESRLAGADLSCPVCHADVDPSFLVCPVCTTKLKQACSSCHAPLEPLWQICPYCETPMQTPNASAPPALGTRRTTTATPRRRSARS
jgi:RNA polymerase subunit RPABC4/transcription elongation factor Spt4